MILLLFMGMLVISVFFAVALPHELQLLYAAILPLFFAVFFAVVLSKNEDKEGEP